MLNLAWNGNQKKNKLIFWSQSNSIDHLFIFVYNFCENRVYHQRLTTRSRGYTNEVHLRGLRENQGF